MRLDIDSESIFSNSRTRKSRKIGIGDPVPFMLSHTVPKKLLEKFAYYDPATRSLRLWQYHAKRSPWGRAAPRRTTAWEGHFAHPDDKGKEAEIENRLKREVEDPVNRFIDETDCASFSLQQQHTDLMSRYMRMLFNRSKARQLGSAESVRAISEAFTAFSNDQAMVRKVADHYSFQMIQQETWAGVSVKPAHVIRVAKTAISRQSDPKEVQRDYIRSLEAMFSFPDKRW